MNIQTKVSVYDNRDELNTLDVKFNRSTVAIPTSSDIGCTAAVIKSTYHNGLYFGK